MNRKDWKMSLKEAITDPKVLLDLLELDTNQLPELQKSAELFALKVPRGFVARMEKGNLSDPLLQQILPMVAEQLTVAGYSTDPLQETQYNRLPGLLHKYHGRVLLTFTGVCGVNCRYCFRRHFAYEENNPGHAGWQKALEYIAQDQTITEVILSGGDPLIANDATLAAFSRELTAISHVKRLRIHSRMPIVVPERMTPELLDALTAPQFKTVLVVHANHPREINQEVIDALQATRSAGWTLLNQAVLLKSINDDIETLVALSEQLFAAGVLPYYLHVLDKVQGAAHFDLPRETALALHNAMAARLSGYLVPKLVCEQPGALAKTAIKPESFFTD